MQTHVFHNIFSDLAFGPINRLVDELLNYVFCFPTASMLGYQQGEKFILFAPL